MLVTTLDELCQGNYSSASYVFSSDSVKKPLEGEAYLFCSDEQYLAANWEKEISGHNWLNQYQDEFSTLEQEYSLPKGTLSAIAAPRGFETPRDDYHSEHENTFGFFRLDKSTLSSLGIGKEDFFNTQITAEAIAKELSKNYSTTQDLDQSVSATVGIETISDRREFLTYLLSGQRPCTN